MILWPTIYSDTLESHFLAVGKGGGKSTAPRPILRKKSGGGVWCGFFLVGPYFLEDVKNLDDLHLKNFMLFVQVRNLQTSKGENLRWSMFNFRGLCIYDTYMIDMIYIYTYIYIYIYIYTYLIFIYRSYFTILVLLFSNIRQPWLLRLAEKTEILPFRMAQQIWLLLQIFAK